MLETRQGVPMDYLIAICAFLGSWLLVAGAIHQAALEFQEVEFDREEFAAATSSVPAPERVSAWWWLLPPVAYLLQQRRNKTYHAAVLKVLGPEQRTTFVAFQNTAVGWLVVASGAFLLAIKETWQLCLTFDWHVAVFWLLVVVLPLFCVGNVVRWMARANGILRGEAERAHRPRRPK
jgi:hypothetical protein